MSLSQCNLILDLIPIIHKLRWEITEQEKNKDDPMHDDEIVTQHIIEELTSLEMTFEHFHLISVVSWIKMKIQELIRVRLLLTTLFLSTVIHLN